MVYFKVVTSAQAVQQLISDKELEIARAVLLRINYIILPFALLVTVVNIVVFLHKSMRSSTGHYVVGLSLAQLGYLVIDIGYHIMLALLTDPRKSYVYFVYGTYLINFSLAALRSGSYLVLCLVSVERLYAVWRPLHIKTFLLARFPTTCTIAAFVMSALAHFYLYVKLEIKAMPDKDGGTRYGMVSTAFYLKNSEFIDNFSIGTKVVLSYLVLCVLMVLNTLTLVFLRRHTVKRRSLKSSSSADSDSKREWQMTVTILGATGSYVFLSLPLAVHSIVSSLCPSYNVYAAQSSWTNLYVVNSSVTYQCVLLSCFTDFFSFIMLSSAYKRTFLQFFSLPRSKAAVEEMTYSDSSGSLSKNVK